MLFVLSELEASEDCANCLLYAEELKSYKLSFFITHEKNRYKEETVLISSKFKHVIYIADDNVNLFQPVKQLIHN